MQVQTGTSRVDLWDMAPMFKKKVVAPLTEEELDAVTIVFHQFETGLREGTIYTKVTMQFNYVKISMIEFDYSL